jgi:hypothetical protein
MGAKKMISFLRAVLRAILKMMVIFCRKMGALLSVFSWAAAAPVDPGAHRYDEIWDRLTHQEKNSREKNGKELVNEKFALAGPIRELAYRLSRMEPGQRRVEAERANHGIPAPLSIWLGRLSTVQLQQIALLEPVDLDELLSGRSVAGIDAPNAQGSRGPTAPWYQKKEQGWKQVQQASSPFTFKGYAAPDDDNTMSYAPRP